MKFCLLGPENHIFCSFLPRKQFSAQKHKIDIEKNIFRQNPDFGILEIMFTSQIFNGSFQLLFISEKKNPKNAICEAEKSQFLDRDPESGAETIDFHRK